MHGENNMSYKNSRFTLRFRDWLIVLLFMFVFCLLLLARFTINKYSPQLEHFISNKLGIDVTNISFFNIILGMVVVASLVVFFSFKFIKRKIKNKS